jgi:hypothetical protein
MGANAFLQKHEIEAYGKTAESGKVIKDNQSSGIDRITI